MTKVRAKPAVVAGSVAALALLIVVALIAAEGFVRLRQYWRTGMFTSFESMYRLDSASGLRTLVPGFRSKTISINSLGFRGPELSNSPDVGTFRIAFLGASTTFCQEVSSDDETWPAKVIELLRKQYPNQKLEYVNAAVPGYTVASSLQNWQKRISPLKPDWVVIYHATNDLSQEFRQRSEGTTGFKPPHEADRSWIRNHSLFLELVVKNIAVRKSAQPLAGSEKSVDISPATLGETFRANLFSLSREIGAQGTGLSIATFSIHPRREHDLKAMDIAMQSARLYSPGVSPELLIAGFDRFNQHIRDLGPMGLAHIIGNEFEIPGDPVHFADSVHFTEKGAQRMAERVSEALAGNDQFRNALRLKRN